MSLALRRLAVLPIRLYQWLLSPVLPPSCRFRPTFSAYAIEAVLTHGLGRGTLLALRRLVRCHPWSEGGWDPVPPRREPVTPGLLTSSSLRSQEHPEHHGR